MMDLIVAAPGSWPGAASTTTGTNRPAPAGALSLAKQTPPPEYLIGVEVVALRHHRHRDTRLTGLRHDLTLLCLAPPTTTAANRSAARRARLLIGN